jgi:hypothetical protein
MIKPALITPDSATTGVPITRYSELSTRERRSVAFNLVATGRGSVWTGVLDSRGKRPLIAG